MPEELLRAGVSYCHHSGVHNTRHIFNANTDFYYWFHYLSKYYLYNLHYQYTVLDLSRGNFGHFKSQADKNKSTKKKKKEGRRKRGTNKQFYLKNSISLEGKKKKNSIAAPQTPIRIQLLYFLIFQYQLLTTYQGMAMDSILINELKVKWQQQTQQSGNNTYQAKFEDVWGQFLTQLKETQRLSLHGNGGDQMSQNSDAQMSLLLFVCYFLRYSHSLSPLRIWTCP
ncbi:hypothetical protein RFI_12699 [Reticulomyxa filosa]|uniref:Uncharacterized protein n=1 Tax=Reticulomyxa filosa TaxID=46433 RepID=X6NDR5_RETFI|nr:hypothetical protein RFI_12699 [Reticulomyxa filosa]|eukprot:ETO24460.1 hypothetical protein RFI_12699 [Reticulomyxa filosa]